MFITRKKMSQNKLVKVLLCLALVGTLSACSIPIPLGDLLPELGANKSGTFTIPEISKSGFDLAPFLGESKTKDLVDSTVGQTTIVLDGVDLDGLNPIIDLTSRKELQSKLVSIAMSYTFLFTKVGEYSTSNVALQSYIAPADASKVSDAIHALGAPIKIDFSNGSQTVAATVNLSPTQVQAINDRKLRLGFSLTGTIQDFNSTRAGLRYDIQSLKITNLKANLDERFPTGDNGDVISIASIDTGIAKVNSLTLNYLVTMKQSTPTVLKGTSTVELYLAGVSETTLYSSENLVKSIEVDLAAQPATISGKLKIENPLVETVLKDAKVRYGVKIKGTAIGIEAVTGNDSSVTFEYEVTELIGEAGVGL